MFDKGLIRSEFRCGCEYNCGLDTIDAETLGIVEDLREHYGRPVHVNSGHRCYRHNEDVKRLNPNYVHNTSKSQHLYGRAADIYIDGVDPADVYEYLIKTYPGRYGFGKYKTFTHIDTRSYMARWGV